MVSKQIILLLQPRGGSRASIHEEPEEEAMEAKDARPHKYVIQALVLRDSWPLSQPQWSFVNELKDKEKEELKG